MAVFSWIVRVLAVLGIGAIWWLTAAGLSDATEGVEVARVTLWGAVGILSTYLIARLLTRTDS